ncbi:uncharacterized protein LOC143055070 [Mytilus galloprovincialis]|uniref:uncharacterized protein LOC143055070 n=1 Tax=Mytilus galloprovincialis TaxID=29158 RepID=UPI003F7CA5AF
MKEYIDCNTRLPYYFCNKGSQYSKTTAKVGFSSAVTEENEKTTVNRRYSSYGGLVRSTILSAWTSQAMKQSNGITNSVMTTSGPTKNTSSSIHNIGRSSTRNENRSDVIIGTVVGGLTVIVGVSILLLICKIRSLGIFSKKTDHSIAEFSKESGERSDQSIPKKKQQIVENKRSGLEIQKTKDIYAEVKKTKKTENIKTLYSEVNKIRTLSSDIRKTDDNYIELPEGEYDRLNNFDIRLLEKDSNMYDSNVGIRNVQDPMYDTTLHASRLESEDVYDHSFPNVNTDSNYDCSSSLAHTNIKENDVDKSV